MIIDNDFQYGTLRALKRDDAAPMLEWMHLPQTANIFQNDFNHYELEDVISFIDHSHENEQSVHLAIHDDEDRYLGTISLKNISKNLDAEYAISMSPEARGTGAAAQGTRDLLRFAFQTIGLHRVYLNVREDNKRAIRFYEKMKFTYEGTSRDCLRTENGYIGLLWFSMLHEEWERSF